MGLGLQYEFWGIQTFSLQQGFVCLSHFSFWILFFFPDSSILFLRLTSFACLNCFTQACLPNLSPPSCPSCQNVFSQLREIMIIWTTLIPDSTILCDRRDFLKIWITLDAYTCLLSPPFITRELKNELSFWHYTNRLLSLRSFLVNIGPPRAQIQASFLRDSGMEWNGKFLVLKLGWVHILMDFWLIERESLAKWKSA